MNALMIIYSNYHFKPVVEKFPKCTIFLLFKDIINFNILKKIIQKFDPKLSLQRNFSKNAAAKPWADKVSAVEISQIESSLYTSK